MRAAKIGEGETWELTKDGDTKYVATLDTLFQEGQVVLYAEVEGQEDVLQLLRYQVSI